MAENPKDILNELVSGFKTLRGLGLKTGGFQRRGIGC